MTIISISINDKLLEELDLVQKELGFSGRSEIIRAALRDMVSNNKQISDKNEKVEAALIVIHNEAEINNLKHDFSNIIKTQVHNHISGKCLEVFVISGKSFEVNNLVNAFKKNSKVESVKLIIS
jgi:CopG family transcriptional regulator, nickel-responsive regulator